MLSDSKKVENRCTVPAGAKKNRRPRVPPVQNKEMKSLMGYTASDRLVNVKSRIFMGGTR
jgi:hypothetical protein